MRNFIDLVESFILKPFSAIVFHGSEQRFVQFQMDPERGIYFSGDEAYARSYGPIVYRCRVTISNPRIFDEAEANSDMEIDREALMAQGYDGRIVRYDDGSLDVIAFRLDQITMLELLPEPVEKLDEIEIAEFPKVHVSGPLLNRVWTNSSLVSRAAVEGFDLYQASQNGRTTFSLLNPRAKEQKYPELAELAACLELSKEGPYWQIRFTFVRDPYRKRGLMRFLINHTVASLGPLLSDATQSPEAQKMWTTLVRRPDILNLSMLDPNTGTKTGLQFDERTGEVVPNPWARNNKSMVILAEDERLDWSLDQWARMRRTESIRESLGYGPIRYGSNGDQDWPNP